MMDPDDYQAQAMSFATYGGNPTYAYAGLAEEAGEVLGKYAKFIRKHSGRTPEIAGGFAWGENDYKIYREELTKELGDVLWMVAAICKENNISLADVMQLNINKLQDRKNRGVIVGEGDNR